MRETLGLKGKGAPQNSGKVDIQEKEVPGKVGKGYDSSPQRCLAEGESVGSRHEAKSDASSERSPRVNRFVKWNPSFSSLRGWEGN